MTAGMGLPCASLAPQRSGDRSDGEGERDQQRVSGDAGDQDREHDSPRRVPARIAVSSRHMRGRVEAGVGPLRLQQPQAETPTRRASARCCSPPAAEMTSAVSARKNSAIDHRRDAQDVHGHAEVVQQGDQADAEVVQQALCQQDEPNISKG